MINKRRLFRVKIKGFEKATMVYNDNYKNMFTIILVNISGSGLSFMSKKKFPVSRNKKFTFIFELEGEEFNLKGFIIRKAPRENDKFIEYGVKFTSLTTKQESELISILNKYQSKHYKLKI